MEKKNSKMNIVLTIGLSKIFEFYHFYFIVLFHLLYHTLICENLSYVTTLWEYRVQSNIKALEKAH